MGNVVLSQHIFAMVSFISGHYRTVSQQANLLFVINICNTNRKANCNVSWMQHNVKYSFWKSIILFQILRLSCKCWTAPIGSASSSTRASPANTVRGGSVNARPAASNISLDDITSQLEKASLSMDEAARQTPSSSSSSSSSYSSTTLRRPSSGSSGGGQQHRRTGSVGTVSEQEAPSQRSSVNSACASASSMDSLDIDKVMTGGEAEGRSSPSTQGQSQTSTEVWLADTEIQTHTHTPRG